jgi:hypothetical protein
LVSLLLQVLTSEVDMKPIPIIISLVSVIFVASACSASAQPTPYPTYTPYPTFTSESQYTPSSPMEATDEVPKLLFQDDFDDNTANGWTELGPDWSVQDGEYVVSQEGCSLLTHSLAGDPSWDNYAFEFDVMGTAGTDKPVNFRYADDDNRYWLSLISKTSWGWGPYIRLGKAEGGSESVLAAEDFESQPDVWYHIRIEVSSVPKGESITVFVDGVPLIDYVDENSTLKNGMIALEGWTGNTCEGTVHFDNIEVTSLP